jgi:cytochrome c oxidase subunit 2
VRRGNRTTIEMLIVGAVASAIGIAIALSIHWFPPAASTQAGPIDTLWDVLLIVSVPVFVLVATVVLFAVREFRMKPGQELQDGPPIHGSTRLEVIWTAVPAVVIACLVVYAYLVLHDIEKAPANAATEMHVKVTGQQFTWHFEYPQAGGASVKSDQLYVPAGQSIKFDIVSKDVLHDFWVPAWRMKIDAVPGITTHYRVTPKTLGNYPVVCAELCGLGHAFMRQTAHVLTADQFAAWVKKQGAGAAAAGGASTAAGAKPDGKALFASTDLGCTSCHTLADAKSTGTTGPDLDKALATAQVPDIRTDIAQPNAEIAPGYQPGIMPQDFGTRLSPAQLDALATYLHQVTAK